MATTLNISDIQLYNLLKIKLGEKEAEQLVQFVKAEVEHSVEEKHQYTIKDIAALRTEIGKGFDNTVTKSGLTAAISDSKAEMIKWMFIFVFTSTLTTIGSILAIIKFFFK